MSLAKSVRLEARINPELKDSIDLIAQRQGRTRTDFIKTALQQAVDRETKQMRKTAEHKAMILSAQDQVNLADAIINPPPMKDSLKKAFKKHNKLVVNQ